MLKPLKEYEGLAFTFITTEQCNLRCKYCYETNKRSREMTFDVAKQAIDKLVTGELIADTGRKFAKLGLVIDFLGGDALVNPKLLDKILSYFVYKLQTVDNEYTKIWRQRWKCSISTNGTLFENEDVRKFCEKWKYNLSLGVSIDGCPELHDLNRVYPDGRGSMDVILKWRDWFVKNFPQDSITTKSTLSKDSIPYIYDSLVFMHEKLGMTHIHQNFIMEPNGCTEKDYELLKEQLKKCDEYCLEHRNELWWALIDNYWDFHNSLDDNQNRCGSGCMVTVGVDGKIYPCMRWMPYSIGLDKKDMSTGHISTGITKEGQQLYNEIYENSKNANCTKEEKCKDCKYESVCPYCIAGCYAQYGEFRRTTNICEILKILCENAKEYHEKELLLDQGD